MSGQLLFNLALQANNLSLFCSAENLTEFSKMIKKWNFQKLINLYLLQIDFGPIAHMCLGGRTICAFSHGNPLSSKIHERAHQMGSAVGTGGWEGKG